MPDKNHICEPAEIIRLYIELKAIGLKDYLIKVYGYQHLEGSNFSKDGAYLIHPKEWSKSDIESAKKCFPAMQDAGLQFVGVYNPSEANMTKNYDGILFGLPCELKHYQPNEIISQEKLIKKIKDRFSDANAQKAVIVVVVLKLIEDSSYNWEQIHSRLKGTIKTQYSTLKQYLLLIDKGII